MRSNTSGGKTGGIAVPAALGPLGVAVVVVVALWFMIANITMANDAQAVARAASSIRADLATLSLVEADRAPTTDALLAQLSDDLDRSLDVALAGLGPAESDNLRSLVADRLATAGSGDQTAPEVAQLMDNQFAALAQDAGRRADDASETTVRATYLTATLALLALLGAVAASGRMRAQRAEAAALADAEDRYRALLEHAAVLVYVIGPDGTLEYASPRAQAVYGRTSSRVESLAQQLSSDHAQFAESLIDQTVECEVPHVVRSAAGKWFEVFVSDHRDHPAIGGLVVTARDVSERVALEEFLRRQATEDVLTGTSNRRGLDLALDSAVDAANEADSTLGVLLIDLDGFKQVNDLHGHEAGDEVLSQIGARLSEVVRSGEKVGRYGGDEFAVVVEGITTRDEVEAVASRLMEALRVPCAVDGELLSFGASIGIAMGSGSVEAGALLKEADRAMYRAKQAGGGCWRWAEIRADSGGEQAGQPR